MERLGLFVGVEALSGAGGLFVCLEYFEALVLSAGLRQQVLFRLFHRPELALLAVGIVEAIALLVLFRLEAGHNYSFLLGMEQGALYFGGIFGSVSGFVFVPLFSGILLGCCKLVYLCLVVEVFVRQVLAAHLGFAVH